MRPQVIIVKDRERCYKQETNDIESHSDILIQFMEYNCLPRIKQLKEYYSSVHIAYHGFLVMEVCASHVQITMPLWANSAQLEYSTKAENFFIENNIPISKTVVGIKNNEFEVEEFYIDTDEKILKKIEPNH